MSRRILFPALAILFSVALSLLLIEVFVRTVLDDGMQYDLEMWKYARDVKTISDNPRLGHEHRPNRQARLMGVDLATNSAGLRNREIPYERSEARRVLMLGDSVTLGWGTAFEETFSHRLEQMLRDRGIRAEVVNTGVGNYNTVMQAEYFFTKGIRFRPDVVVLNYFVNDAEPVPQYKSVSWLHRNCYLCVFAAGRVDSVMRLFDRKQDWAEYYLGLYDHGRAKGWLDARAEIIRIGQYCRENNIRFLVASLPELHDVQNYRFGEVTELVRQAAAEAGADFIDALPRLSTTDSRRLWVTPPDPHPNGLAHGLIADALIDKLAAILQAGS